MNKNAYMLFLCISLLYPKISFFIDYSMATNSKYDGKINASSLGLSEIPFSSELEFNNSIYLGFDIPIHKFDEISLNLGFSLMAKPIEKSNLRFSDKPSEKTDLTIGRVFLKTIFPIENNLSVWFMAGINDISSKYHQLEKIDNDIILVIPFRQLDFKNGFSYGAGFDYTMTNGVIAGFNFIYDTSKFDARLKTETTGFPIIVDLKDIDFKILTKSIRLGYIF